MLANILSGFTSSQVVETVLDCDSAANLGETLVKTAQEYRKHVLYVKLPDGSLVFGYDVQEETLTDGSVVYNLLLKAA